jgi:hypothetical protein
MNQFHRRSGARFAHATLAIGAACVGLMGAGCATEARGERADESTEGPVAEAQQELATTCVTLQRGTFGAVEDTTLVPNITYPGWGGELDKIYSGCCAEALVKFDVSALPASATVISATLGLRSTDWTTDSTIFARHGLASWAESTASYDSFNQQVDGQTMGSMVPSLPMEAQTMSLTPATVQAWISGSLANNGMLLEAMVSQAADYSSWQQVGFDSSDSLTVAYRPSLTVCYTNPSNCAVVGCAPSDNPCAVGTCDASTGTCSYTAAPDGTSCDDGNACTTGDTCASGACASVPKSCDDGLSCSVDSCNPTSGGCAHDDAACIPRVCGAVSQQAGGVVSPSDAASVTLACNTPGNIIKGTTTAADGSYCVLLTQDEFASCTSYTLKALKPGYTSQTKVSPGDFTVVQGGVATVPFLLQQLVGGTCFSDTFETAKAWTISAPVDGVRWQRKPNALASVNTAVNQCVLLAADEGTQVCASPGESACVEQLGAVSNAYGGDYALWFGNPDQGTYVGNFLGASGNCSSNNGGASGVVVSGTATSPAFTVPAGAGAKTLQFRSWWEIESVDPQQNAYDRMVVQIVNQAGAVTQIGTLNPDVDANGPASAPYSSGGYNRTPTWNLYDFDLGAYAGQQIQVRFYFMTEDSAYNGYRGWVIDDVAVTSPTCL